MKNNFETIISNDITDIIKKIKSKKYDHFDIKDLELIYDLCDVLNIKNYPKIEIPTDKEFIKNIYRNIFFYTCTTKNFDTLIEIIPKITELFDITKDYDVDLNELSNFISLDDSLDLASDFLEKYNKKYFETLLKVYNNKKLLYFENFSNESKNIITGETYSSYQNYESYIYFLNTNSLVTSVNIVHETTHAYYDYYLKLKKKSSIICEANLFKALNEIPAYLTELHFSKYLDENNIYTNDNQLIKKEYDYFLGQNIIDTYKKITNLDILIDKMISFYYKNISDPKRKLLKEKYKFNIVLSRSDEYLFGINYLFGQLFAYYLFTLDDKEKELYLCDKIIDSKKYDDIKKIFKNENISIEDIITSEKIKKNIRKNWY